MKFPFFLLGWVLKQGDPSVIPVIPVAVQGHNDMVQKQALIGAAVMVGAFASASAFAPAPIARVGAARARLATSDCAPRTRPAIAETKMDMGLATAVAGIPLMYGLLSGNEYVTHRYYQHNEIGKLDLYQTLKKNGKMPKLPVTVHVEHHAETYDDMMLKTDDPVWMKSAPARVLNEDPWRGTIFAWESTVFMFAQCIPSVYPAFWLLGWSFSQTTAFFVPAMLVHGLVWNALHPHMHGMYLKETLSAPGSLPPLSLNIARFVSPAHVRTPNLCVPAREITRMETGLPDVPLSVGLPSSVFSSLRGSPLFEFLRKHHVGHHVASGLANYNVCCPGMDVVVGTFMTEEQVSFSLSFSLSHTHTLTLSCPQAIGRCF